PPLPVTSEPTKVAAASELAKPAKPASQQVDPPVASKTVAPTDSAPAKIAERAADVKTSPDTPIADKAPIEDKRTPVYADKARKKELEAVAHEAKPTATGERSLVRALGLKIGKIVVDAGHGGHDTGTVGPGGYCEKDLTLDVALRLG